MSVTDIGIGYKIVIVVALAAILPLAAVGYYANVKSSKAMEDNSLATMAFEVKEVADSIKTFLDVVRQDAIFLETVPPIQGIVRARDNGGYDQRGKSTYQQWVNRLGVIYAGFGKAKPYYLQLRYLNEAGDEMVRVDFEDGRAKIIPAKDLQNKARTTYFTDTMKMAQEQVHVSVFNLNREHGRIEVPHKPVVRFGVPVFDAAGRRRGAVILNVLGEGILNFMPKQESGVLGNFYLVNKEGYYLHHSDTNKTWGFELGRKDNLFKEIPELAGLTTTNRIHHTLRDIQGLVLAYTIIHPNPKSLEDRWIVVSTIAREKILASVIDFQRALYFLAGISLFISIVVGLWLTRSWFVKPLNAILEVLNSFARGNLSVRLDSIGSDEIGRVGHAFNLMAKEQQQSQQREQQQAERERQQLEQLRKAADIRERVEILLKHIKRVTEGDLRHSIELNGDDDLAQLAAHLNGMTQSIAQISGEIRTVVETLNTTLAEVNSATSTQAATASQQAIAVTETTTTLEEIRQTSEQTLTKATQLGEVAQRTKLESSQGQAAVQEAIEGMQAIRSRVDDIAQTILALSEQTLQIGEITDVVNSLAQQSKMLALNASIEAAKAGDAGKGFAVVADEVKDLAEQSQQSTAQVQKILQEIRQATDRAVMATEEGTKGVDAGVALTERTGEVMWELSKVINDTVTASQQIVAAVRQEATGVDQVNSAMRDINETVRTFVSSSRQMEEANNNIVTLAEKLSNSVAIYKV